MLVDRAQGVRGQFNPHALLEFGDVQKALLNIGLLEMDRSVVGV